MFYSKYADETGLSIRQTAVRVSKWDLNQWKNIVSSFDMSDWPVEAQDRVQTYGVQAGHDRTALIGAIIGINLADAAVKVQRATQKRLEADSDDEVKRLKKQSDLTKKQADKLTKVIEPKPSETVPKGMKQRDKAISVTTDPDNVAIWSKNLWLDHDELAHDVQKLVNKHLKHGMSLHDLQDLLMAHTNPKQFKPNQNIGDRIKTAQTNTQRIIRTESSRLVNSANLTTFRIKGYDYVGIQTEPDACDTCKLLAKQGPYSIGTVPYIPVHPNCRCVYVPRFNSGVFLHQTFKNLKQLQK